MRVGRLDIASLNVVALNQKMNLILIAHWHQVVSLASLQKRGYGERGERERGEAELRERERERGERGEAELRE